MMSFNPSTLPAKTVIVFDFDCTLTSIHYYYFRKGLLIDPVTKGYDIDPSDLRFLETLKILKLQLEAGETGLFAKQAIIDHIFGGAQRFESLCQFLQRLSVQNDLRIASRGNPEQILELLDIIKLRRYFPDNKVTGSETSKVTLIQFLLQHSNVLYVDDDREEHERILREKRKLPGTHYVFCTGLEKDGKGIGAIIMQKMEAEALRLNQGPAVVSASAASSSALPPPPFAVPPLSAAPGGPRMAAMTPQTALLQHSLLSLQQRAQDCQRQMMKSAALQEQERLLDFIDGSLRKLLLEVNNPFGISCELQEQALDYGFTVKNMPENDLVVLFFDVHKLITQLAYVGNL